MKPRQEYELVLIAKRLSRLMKYVDEFHEDVIQGLDDIATRLSRIVEDNKVEKGDDYIQ